MSLLQHSGDTDTPPKLSHVQQDPEHSSHPQGKVLCLLNPYWNVREQGSNSAHLMHRPALASGLTPCPTWESREWPQPAVADGYKGPSDLPGTSSASDPNSFWQHWKPLQQPVWLGRPGNGLCSVPFP